MGDHQEYNNNANRIRKTGRDIKRRIEMQSITFINHSTILIKIEDMVILTDPVYSKWLGLPIIGAKRTSEPGIKLKDLPKIDMVLISHNHYDHLDMPALKYLNNKFNPIFIVGKGTNLFKNHSIELDWWQEYQKICFVPAKHWSGRMPWSINKSLWGGFIIKTDRGAIYFAGDTGFDSYYFNQIKQTFPEIILSLLPIAPSNPLYHKNHMNLDEAVKAHKILNSKLSIGIHHGTFFDRGEDIKGRLKESIELNNIDDNEFIVLNNGDTCDF